MYDDNARIVLAAHLVLYRHEGADGDEIALDFVEFIALRIPRSDDRTIFELALWVRSVLAAYKMEACSFCETLDLFEQVARAAKGGLAELVKTIQVLRIGAAH